MINAMLFGIDLIALALIWRFCLMPAVRDARRVDLLIQRIRER